MANWGAAGSGAMSGAATGSAIMPGWGTAIGAGIGGLMGLFSGDPGKGYKKAGKQINKSWQEALGYMKPYQQNGMDEYGRLRDATGALLDPAALESKWMEGYKTSPYAQHEAGVAKEQGLDAASSMGLIGSSPALESIQTNMSNILNADRRNYLQDLMDKYMAGIKSSQGVYGIGANTAGEIGRGAIQTGENLAKLKYGETNASGEQINSMFGQMIGQYGGNFGKFNGSRPDIMENADGSISRFTPRGGAY